MTFRSCQLAYHNPLLRVSSAGVILARLGNDILHVNGVLSGAGAA
jgi:hypothetical protein